jgi:hypothetical protein
MIYILPEILARPSFCPVGRRLRYVCRVARTRLLVVEKAIATLSSLLKMTNTIRGIRNG